MLFDLFSAALPAAPSIPEQTQQYLRGAPFSVQTRVRETPPVPATGISSLTALEGGHQPLKWFGVEQNALVLKTAQGFQSLLETGKIASFFSSWPAIPHFPSSM